MSETDTNDLWVIPGSKDLYLEDDENYKQGVIDRQVHYVDIDSHVF